MNSIKRLELLEDVLRHIKKTKRINIMKTFKDRLQRYNVLSRDRMRFLASFNVSDEDARKLHKSELLELNTKVVHNSPRDQATIELQLEIGQLDDLKYLLRSPSGLGGTKNADALVCSIQTKQRSIQSLFDKFNLKFMVDLPKFSLESPEVLNRIDGSFWHDCIVQPEIKIRNRTIIDSWCKVQRINEALHTLKDDIHRYLDHIVCDVKSLDDPYFAPDLDLKVKDGYQILINRKIHAMMASCREIRNDVILDRFLSE